MKIRNSVALVTGANRGLGLAFAQELLARGAARVYAAARDPGSVRLDGVVPVRLDVTRPEQVAEAADRLDDVTLLVNNAGILAGGAILGPAAFDALQAEMETNVYGPLRLARAFAPILQTQGGGAILNVLSVLSWLNIPSAATYSVSKAAAWSMTNALRGELAGQRTQVAGLHVGYMDTDMTAGLDAPKSDPRAVAALALDVIEAGGTEVLADELSRQVKGALSSPDAPYLVPPSR